MAYTPSSLTSEESLLFVSLATSAAFPASSLSPGTQFHIASIIEAVTLRFVDTQVFQTLNQEIKTYCYQVMPVKKGRRV